MSVLRSAVNMFRGKVIIVTGSSTGIGAGTAVKFAEEGAAAITITGRQEAALKNVKERVEKAGNGKTKVNVVVGDVTDPKVTQRLINETVEKFGQLDVLVNNAGFNSPPCPTATAPIADFDKIMNVNLRSMVIMSQLAIPHLEKTKGNIVNISSAGGIKGINVFTFYCMSKAAMDHFTRCLAVELGPKGIRVNSVNPGSIPETELAAKTGANAEQLQASEKMFIDKTPLRRSGTIEECANVITYIASEKASFITGTTTVADGGITLS